MDKNTIIGFGLIAAILIGFTYFTQPSEQELAQLKRAKDSVALAELAVKEAASVKNTTKSAEVVLPDSLKNLLNVQQYGAFAANVGLKNEELVLENDYLKAFIHTKGARIAKVVLKNYDTYTGEPLVLFTEDSSQFAFDLNLAGKKISSDSLTFQADLSGLKKNEQSSISLKAIAGENKYLEIVYTISPKSYLVKSQVNVVGLNDVLDKGKNLQLNWMVSMPAHEKSKLNEKNASTIYYQNSEAEVDYLTETKDTKENIEEGINWIAFKQQFFTSTLISDRGFMPGAEVEMISSPDSSKYLKRVRTSLNMEYKNLPLESYGLSFYFGPNHYNTLKEYGHDLELQVPLGWGIFGMVNRFIVIPVFNFLDSFNWSYGIVILILTLVIKTLLFPMTYKAYLSTAKMRVLKPEMDEINKKFENGDPLQKQQATMALYKQAGVNPLGGCLPMLLQLPILIALFRFFPSSIELRQKAFLWADDLSSYDSIMDLPFNIPFYGDHVSLFTILMTITTIIYTRMNNQLTGGNDQQMQAMKWMMYLMPVIFLGVMNQNSAALSYYYFLANLITFGQQWLMRKFVDEESIHAKIQENKKKPATKSKFQEKLEEMAKQKGVQLPNQTKKK